MKSQVSACAARQVRQFQRNVVQLPVIRRIFAKILFDLPPGRFAGGTEIYVIDPFPAVIIRLVLPACFRMIRFELFRQQMMKLMAAVAVDESEFRIVMDMSARMSEDHIEA